MTSPNFGQRYPCTYREGCTEVLPPLRELIAEHDRMRREIAAAKRIAEESFRQTMARWHARELKAKAEEAIT